MQMRYGHVTLVNFSRPLIKIHLLDILLKRNKLKEDSHADAKIVGPQESSVTKRIYFGLLSLKVVDRFQFITSYT